jgi:hypothetical protein
MSAGAAPRATGAIAGNAVLAAEITFGNALAASGAIAETAAGISAASAGKAPTGSPKPL